jgi:hypothetical protein
MNSPCPCCRQRSKGRGNYLCRTCWFGLPTAARNALNRRDSRAYPRLRELHKQLEAGVPLAEIRITA